MSPENENIHTSDNTDNNNFFQAASHFDKETPSVTPVVPPATSPASTVPPVTQPVSAPEVAAKKPKPKKSSNKLWIILVAVALCAALVGALGGGFLSYLLLSDEIDSNITVDREEDDDDKDKDEDAGDDDNKDSPSDNTSNSAKPSGTLTGEEIYAQNVNSTVTILADNSIGSGFIYATNGDIAYIVTNHHVVSGAKNYRVVLYNETELSATLLGSDKKNDIAVLKVQQAGLKAVTLGDSDRVMVGQTIYAIGAPLGTLPFSISSGIVSGLKRQISVSGTTMTLMQTDCPINSGNSGGAVFNTSGEVVAVVVAKSSDGFLSFVGLSASVDNVGFVIPLNDVKDIISDFIESDK